MRLWRRFLLILLLVVIAAVAGSYLYLRSSLPQTSGRIILKGLAAEIRIERDSEGIPLIAAASDADAAFGLGFVHAQDRLFQMEMQRRYGAGRLAELLGSPVVDIDRQMRVLGLYRGAEAEIPFLSPELRQALDSYAAGVNAFLDSRNGALPPEFLLLRHTPEPWRVADTLVWGKLMALQLGGNYRGELLRARLAAGLSPEDLAFLYPGYPPEAPTTLAAMAPIYKSLALDRLYDALPAGVGPIYASNNWVVDGAHSASGKPILANDPHLGFGAPGFWYLARLKTPEHEISGGTAAGAPFVVIGHNERIAWGFTTTASDVEDLFVERVDPRDPTRYATPGGSAPFETREETIRVRDAAPVSMIVRSTRHGPVLSDVLAPSAVAPGYVLALSATLTIPDDRTADALWRMSRARDWTSFREALRDFAGPQQNMVYADVDGTIGFIAPARIPIRRSGEGWLPMPGWTGDYDWTGFVPFDRLPQATNPASGHFVSANNRIVPRDYPYFLGRDWDLPNRAERIEQMLAATPMQSMGTSAAMQADTYSIMASRLVPLMTAVAPRDADAGKAIDSLRRWDFRMERNAVAPLIFTAWLRAFSRAVLNGRLGEAGQEYWDLRPAVMQAILTGRPDWCGTPTVPASDCKARLADALDAALQELRAALGPDMAQWRWGGVHEAVFPHALFSRIPVLRDWFRIATATSGGYDTIDRGASAIRDPVTPYQQRFGAGLRIVTDLAGPAGSAMIAVPGQSGNPLSPHFADLLSRWRDFTMLTPGTAAATQTLVLAPSP